VNSNYLSIQHQLIGFKTEKEGVYCAVGTECLNIIQVILNKLGTRAMAQAAVAGLSKRRTEFGHSPCEMCDGQRIIGTGYCPSISVVLCQHNSNKGRRCSCHKDKQTKPGDLPKAI
jgi:hypothetical protein